MQPKILIILVVITFCSLSRAQTGSIDPTREQLTGIRSIAVPAVELIEEKVVDLRPWLPPVGRQMMNDCTAWSVGYAAKTYLEARDQGWRPDRASRIFSPRFLYNQINGGKDNGSNFIKAIRLMAAKGAATLATSAYRAGDFTGQPTPRALAEAKAFPVHEPVLIWERRGIRRALQRRQIVIFGAHVSPIFLGGRFKVYTPQLFAQDCKNRKPGQPHGKHAMVICGYDDSKGAFLVQNSWGKAWGKRGFCWLKYELFDNIELKNDDSTFCNWACFIEDVEEKVFYDKAGLPRPRKLDVKSLKPSGYSDITKFDRKRKKFVYSFTAKLAGQPAALAKVKKVTWIWTNELGVRADFTTTVSGSRFSFHAGTLQNPLKLQVNMLLDDGRIRTETAEIVGPNPKSDFRRAKIIFEDDYYGPGAGGKPNFWWEAHLDGPLEQMQDIVKVVWTVGKNMNFRDPIQTNTGFNGPPAQEKAIGMCQVPSEVAAEIHYADGGIKTVHGTMVIADEPNEAMELDITSHKLNQDIWGRTNYAFSISLDLPRRHQFDVDSITYSFDPWISRTKSWSNRTFDHYIVHGTASRDFRVIATVKLEGGGTKTLEKWVTLGPETRYADKDRIEIISWDRYNGLVNNKASYTAYFMLAGDRQQLAKIKEARWQRPNQGNNKSTEVFVPIEDNDPTCIWTFKATDMATLKARLIYKDGRERTIEQTHRVKSLPDDTFGFEVSMPQKKELYLGFKNQNVQQFTIAPLGGDHEVASIIGVDWYHQVRNIKEISRHRAGRLGSAQAWPLTSGITEPFLLEAVIHKVDGYDELLRTKISETTIGELRSELQLRMEEKFWGYSGGKPLWQLRLSIGQDHRARPSEVARVKYTLRAIDSKNPYVPFESAEPRGTFGCRMSKPCIVIADVTFKDKSTARLEGFAPAAALRHPQSVYLRDIYDTRSVSFRNKRMLIVDSWERERPNIDKVKWDTDRDYFDLVHEFSSGTPRVIHYTRIPDKDERIDITVTMKDKSTRHWNIAYNKKPTNLTWDLRSRYWGKGQWQLDAQVAGDWFEISRLSKGFSASGKKAGKIKFELVGSWPLGKRRAWVKPAVYRGLRARAGDETLAPKTIKAGLGLRPPQEALGLEVSTSPFHHQEATVPEFIMRVRGPEGIMTKIVKVEYLFKDSRDRHAHVDRRWGEFYGGYEHRIWVNSKPLVTALVTMASGEKIKLKYKP